MAAQRRLALAVALALDVFAVPLHAVPDHTVGDIAVNQTTVDPLKEALAAGAALLDDVTIIDPNKNVTEAPTVASLSVYEQPAEPSKASCADLGWPVSGVSHGRVCMDSEIISGRECSEVLTWAAAHALCRSVGARLCTSYELENDNAADPGRTGCGLDNVRLWTESRCTDGITVYTQAGCARNLPTIPMQCTRLDEKHATRCCADTGGATEDTKPEYTVEQLVEAFRAGLENSTLAPTASEGTQAPSATTTATTAATTTTTAATTTKAAVASPIATTAAAPAPTAADAGYDIGYAAGLAAAGALPGSTSDSTGR